MPAERNREIIRGYLRRPTAEAYAQDAELHDTSQPAPFRGHAEIGAFLEMFLEAFPEGEYELHSLLADGDAVAAEWTFRGVNRGSAMGHPPTGRAVEFAGASVYDLRDGRIQRARVYYDTGRLAEQLGLTGARIPASERLRWQEWWGAREG